VLVSRQIRDAARPLLAEDLAREQAARAAAPAPAATDEAH
jgi:hypothetical protein